MEIIAWKNKLLLFRTIIIVPYTYTKNQLFILYIWNGKFVNNCRWILTLFTKIFTYSCQNDEKWYEFYTAFLSPNRKIVSSDRTVYDLILIPNMFVDKEFICREQLTQTEWIFVSDLSTVVLGISICDETVKKDRFWFKHFLQ